MQLLLQLAKGHAPNTCCLQREVLTCQKPAGSCEGSSGAAAGTCAALTGCVVG